MDDELHAARLVEEALEDERLAGRQDAERAVRRAEIIDDLLGCRAVEPEIVCDPVQARSRRAGRFEAALELGAEARDRLRQLLAAARRLAEPKRNRRRLRHARPPRAPMPRSTRMMR